MTQDFAKTPRAGGTASKAKTPRANTRRASTKTVTKTPLWAWLVMGMLLMLLALVLTYVANPWQNITHKAKEVLPKSWSLPDQTPTIRFDFYDMLQQQTVELPSDDTTLPTPTESDRLLFLQAASFRNESDADQLRATLLLSNLEARIEIASNQGQQWYRVVVGPFTSRSRMAKARSVLADHQISPLLLKRPLENSP